MGSPCHAPTIGHYHPAGSHLLKAGTSDLRLGSSMSMEISTVDMSSVISGCCWGGSLEKIALWALDVVPVFVLHRVRFASCMSEAAKVLLVKRSFLFVISWQFKDSG